MILTSPQIRVLGALIEKEITTPDAYPLSLHALQAAANQRSSRDPVMDLGDDEIRTALHGLEDLGLAGPARPSLHAPAGRVGKFEHHARTALQLRRDEVALLCLLLLRGPQTPGELRARADRLHGFEDLAAVMATLDRLAAPVSAVAGGGQTAQRPLVQALARQPGSRETRYQHLLHGASAARPEPTTRATGALETVGDRGMAAGATESRLLALEDRLAQLEETLTARITELEDRLAEAPGKTGQDHGSH